MRKTQEGHLKMEIIVDGPDRSELINSYLNSKEVEFRTSRDRIIHGKIFSINNIDESGKCLKILLSASFRLVFELDYRINTKTGSARIVLPTL